MRLPSHFLFEHHLKALKLPVSKAGAVLLFDVISTAYERTSVIVTTNLPFQQWTEVLGGERLTGATLDRLTHRCQLLEASGPSYRLRDAKRRRQTPAIGASAPSPTSKPTSRSNDLARTYELVDFAAIPPWGHGVPLLCRSLLFPFIRSYDHTSATLSNHQALNFQAGEYMLPLLGTIEPNGITGRHH